MTKTFVILTLFIGGTALAQQTSTQAPAALSFERPQEAGVRVALTYSSFNSTVKTPGQKVSNDLGKGFGASVGYAKLPVRQLGYLASLSLAAIDVEDSTSDVNFARLEANGAYAVNPRVFIKAGVNVSDIMNSDARVNPGFGGQVGIGTRPTRNIGFEVNYVTMNQTNTAGPREADLTESGLELGVTGTF